MSEYDPFDELPEVDLLPAYLRASAASAGKTYGELSYNKRSRSWVIKGEPIVCQMAKRLFPGCDGKGRGVARFPANRRNAGDLHWLMLRYPLAVRPTDAARWEQALQDARDYAAARERARCAPQALDPSPAFFRGQLMPFQREGAAYLVNTPRALLADEMGLGKTVQALAAVAELQAYPLLLVVPPHLVTNWQREIRSFLRNADGSEPTVHVLRGLKPYDLPCAQIYIVHYLLLRGWKQALPKLDFAAVIFDEIQELRHSGTEKYSAASLVAEKAPRVIGLSGTPIYNRGGEIWNVINILDFHALGDWESFTREWCYGYGNNIVAKPELLGETLREEGYMLRRTKDAVLDQLPPKRRLVQEIDADDAVYRELMIPAMEALRRLREKTRQICGKKRHVAGRHNKPVAFADRQCRRKPFKRPASGRPVGNGHKGRTGRKRRVVC